jgi:hypothetical protein
MWLALLEISGFGKARKKLYIDNTCKLQVIGRSTTSVKDGRGDASRVVSVPFC